MSGHLSPFAKIGSGKCYISKGFGGLSAESDGNFSFGPNEKFLCPQQKIISILTNHLVHKPYISATSRELSPESDDNYLFGPNEKFFWPQQIIIKIHQRLKKDLTSASIYSNVEGAAGKKPVVVIQNTIQTGRRTTALHCYRRFFYVRKILQFIYGEWGRSCNTRKGKAVHVSLPGRVLNHSLPSESCSLFGGVLFNVNKENCHD